MASRFQFRRANASSWTSANPTLAAGELGFELDTGKFKIGDGTTAWTSLAYSSSSGGGGGVPTTRSISTTAPLSGGGDLSADRTLSISSASTSTAGAVQLTDSTSSTSTTTAATPNSVKGAYDLANTANTTAGAAIPKTAADAKGELPVGNGTTTASLTLGTDGYVLTADSTQTLGVKWAAATGGGGGVSTGKAIAMSIVFGG